MGRIFNEKGKHITFHELTEGMREFNIATGETLDLTAVIVYKSSNWPDKAYTEQQRSYRVSNHNRAFEEGKISNSLFGDCLDGKDLGVRLDWYRWEPEYCYFE